MHTERSRTFIHHFDSFIFTSSVRACVRAEEEYLTSGRRENLHIFVRVMVGAVFIIVKPEDFRRICPYYLRVYMLASLPHHELTILLSYQ